MDEIRIYWVDGWGWQWRPVLDFSSPQIECPSCHQPMAREGARRYVCPVCPPPPTPQEVD